MNRYLLLFCFSFICNIFSYESSASMAVGAKSSHAKAKAPTKPSATVEQPPKDPIVINTKKVLNVYGSYTVYVVLSKYLNQLEKNLGMEVNLIESDPKEALIHLNNGTADIAMLSSKPDVFIRKIPGVDIKKFTSFCVGDTKIVFIINKKNNVKSIYLRDIKAILAGVITNWKDLVGFNKEILVVTEYAGDGIRNFVEEELMYHQPLTIPVKAMIDSAQVVTVVSKVPNALGITVEALAEGQDVDIIKTDRSTLLPLYLLSSDNKKEDTSAFIAEVRKFNIGGGVQKYIDQEKATEGDEKH